MAMDSTTKVATAMGIYTVAELDAMGLEFRPVTSRCHICHKQYQVDLLFNKVEEMNDPIEGEWEGTCEPCFDDLCD